MAFPDHAWSDRHLTPRQKGDDLVDDVVGSSGSTHAVFHEFTKRSTHVDLHGDVLTLRE